MSPENIIKAFKDVVPAVDFWSLRLMIDNSESLTVRQGVVQPPHISQSRGVHITLATDNGFAYGATSTLTPSGFKQCIEQALRWSKLSAKHALFNATDIPKPQQSGHFESAVSQSWQSTSFNDKINLLQNINQQLNLNDCIVDWQAHLNRSDVLNLLITSDGIEIEQSFHYVYPGYEAVANKGSQTQIRSGGGWGSARQGGLEQLAAFDFPNSAQRCAEEAIALVDAAECPNDNLSLLLLPSQMMLQIHESIGHPLELDRIMGDERNYAGTSFVTRDMFGSYQYGSDLLNVTFDPTLSGELASYAFDDDGTPAAKEFLIKGGVLQRPLGGSVSQMRADMQGVANARACDWNRPSMDRMANLNIEPGTSSLTDMVAGIENGILMDTNKSWSIDDSRNKFQFGCELGRMIKDGELKGIVRNPNYRGISANFWRNLIAVGDHSTFEIWGTPNCGKGEPNQVIQVGHASPACVFNNIDVFGGE